MRIATFDEATSFRADLPGGTTIISNFVGAAGVLQDSPQAYIVNIPDRGSHVPPHFHDIDQFQIVVEGEGRCGKQQWRPGAFYYSDAYASYGPIVAGEGGVSLFTLRVASSSGQYEMPGSGHLIPDKPGRAAYGQFDVTQPLPPAGAPVERSELASRQDGMSVLGLRFGPGSVADDLPSPSSGGGQYIVICSGSLVVEGRTLPRLSLVFVSADEDAPVLQAGPEGANVAVLQFGKPSDRAGSDPRKLAGRKSVEYVVAGTDKPLEYGKAEGR